MKINTCLTRIRLVLGSFLY